MNKKDNYKLVLEEIQGMTKKIRSINEAISYGDEEAEAPMPEEEEEGVPSPQEAQPEEEGEPMPEEEDALEGESDAIEQIREIALKGMVALCKTPEDGKYQALKKVFTMIDKSIEDKNNPQQISGKPMA